MKNSLSEGEITRVKLFIISFLYESDEESIFGCCEEENVMYLSIDCGQHEFGGADGTFNIAYGPVLARFWYFYTGGVLH